MKNNRVQLKYLATDLVASTLFHAPTAYNPHHVGQELKQLYIGMRVRALAPMTKPSDAPEDTKFIWRFEVCEDQGDKLPDSYLCVGMPPIYMGGKIYDDEFPNGRIATPEEKERLRLKINALK